MDSSQRDNLHREDLGIFGSFDLEYIAKATFAEKLDDLVLELGIVERLNNSAFRELEGSSS